ncbi:oxidoreductase AflY [Podospora fimiseda]|uniref:Oxidoreductase AflY n=1 Tax=Podospora fimiseda TaxID=252190 RepID=A0AAN7H5L6_9PEZI|nr:oxidoreductase AflY [Podospora fimiseda]
MGQQTSRAVFDGVLTKTHVEHALVQQDGQHNDLPLALATLLFLDGTPAMFHRLYELRKDRFSSWVPSPGSITDASTKLRFLGDTRFQRAFMTFFSMENGTFGGNSKALAVMEFFNGPKPLLYGLFSGSSMPLALLSNGLELRSSVLVVQSLTLAAVEWSEPIFEILGHPQLSRPACELLPPEEIIRRVAYDGRFSGVMKSGPGYHGVANIFSNASSKTAIVEYIQQLDIRNISQVMPQLSQLAVLLLCGTHKPNFPAFDLYLSHIVTCINSTRVILASLEDSSHRILLVRGVWLFILLLYITQLRPVTDMSLVLSTELPEGKVWDMIHTDFVHCGVSTGKYGDVSLLRVLRSLWELDKAYGSIHGKIYTKAAWKLVNQWQTWTGLGGGDREGTLNIRL